MRAVKLVVNHQNNLARLLDVLEDTPNELTIEGGATLGAATHHIGPDHIEVGSFIGLAAVTRSELRIESAGVEHLRSTLLGFERLGITCRVEGADLVVPLPDSARTIAQAVSRRFAQTCR